MEATQVGLALVAAGIGSLAPDIDHPRSTISSGIPRWLVNGALWRLLIIVLVGTVVAFASRRALSDVLWGWYETPIVQTVVWLFLVAIVIGVGLKVTSLLVSELFGHRGATHSLAFLVVATLVAVGLCYLLGFPLIYGIIFGWGYLSHLLADSLTPMGLPDLLWPMA
jgi:membrane-bound metal-dependent hydrolase YbcI (DUF457 family)